LQPEKVYINAAFSRTLILKENKGKSGIYLWLNTTNFYFYIGSSSEISRRLRYYYTSQKYSTYIHRAIAAYGMDKFTLFILEYTHKENIFPLEQYWLDYLNPSYNISKIAGGLPPGKFKTKEETKKLFSDIAKARVWSPEIKK
jgi:group I intron endonuclease